MKKILIVEDTEPFASNLNDEIRECGYLTDKVNKGEEAIIKLKKNSYAGIIIDLKLEDSQISGLGILEWIKEHKKDISIIVITAHPHLANQVLNHGIVDNLFFKPIDESHIANNLSKAIVLKSAMKENKYLKRENKILKNSNIPSIIIASLVIIGFLTLNILKPKDYLANFMLFILSMIWIIGGKRISLIAIKLFGQDIKIKSEIEK